MPDSLFVFAVLALLLTPGPTNTLLTVGAASRGLRASLPLLLGELAGYLVVVTPLAVAATAFLEDRPAFAIALRVAAACWVLFLALRLWHHADRGQGGLRPVTIGPVFMTTVLNPKAAIIGAVVMPHGPLVEIAPALGLLSLLVLGAGSAFVVLGSLVGRTPILAPSLIYRLGAVFLLIFSIGLAGSVSSLI